MGLSDPSESMQDRPSDASYPSRPLRFDVITLFPEMFSAIIDAGITARAIATSQVSLVLTQLRNFSKNAYKSVDDRPYGGGPGMLIQPDPLVDAISHIGKLHKEAGIRPALTILLSPQGSPLTDSMVKKIYQQGGATLLAGRYEGIDQRFIDRHVDLQISIGDYVLSGGELPAMVLIDAVIRQLPEALGCAQSAVEESFADGLLDHPQYTRSQVMSTDSVPEVLLNGHHKDIEAWRLSQRLMKTWLIRPDLLEKRFLTPVEKNMLAESQRKLKQQYRF